MSPELRHGGVWYCIPSCNPKRAREVTEAWREMGYTIAVLVDRHRLDDYIWGDDAPDFVIETKRYHGYYQSINLMARFLRGATLPKGVEVLSTWGRIHPFPGTIVTGGDDIFPDEKRTALEIRDELYAQRPDGFFVMQPIGDMVAMPGTERICGSPWFGDGWLKRAYGGTGPFCSEYHQFYGDEELFNVARKTGALIQRDDLTQRHEHYHRPGGPPKTDYQARNESHFWAPDQKVFFQRQKHEWPGHEPLADLVNERFGGPQDQL